MKYEETDVIYQMLDRELLPKPMYEPSVEEIKSLIVGEKEFNKYAAYLLTLDETYPHNKPLCNIINQYCDKYIKE